MLAAAAPDEIEIVTSYLSGSLRQRRTGVGWRSAQATVPPASEPSLTVTEVDAVFEALAGLSGSGSQLARKAQLDDLMAQATADEQQWLAGLITGETRQGALDGLMIDAVPKASGMPPADIRRAVMLAGATPPVAHAALTQGADAIADIGLVVGRPVRPMLAASAKTVAEAMAALPGEVAVEAKLDGIRIQAHRDGEVVRLFTRSLDDITDRLPEVVAAVAALPVRRAILDGEALSLGADGRPMMFQDTASADTSLIPFFFDLLALDDDELLDLPARERNGRLAPARSRVLKGRPVGHRRCRRGPGIRRANPGGRSQGVVIKALDAPYEAGRRGFVVGEGEACTHPRPGGAGRRVGFWTAPRQGAVEHSPGRP